ncbi:MAG: hypothetical protein ABI947_12040 [Chloroflexota bacterium]
MDIEDKRRIALHRLLVALDRLDSDEIKVYFKNLQDVANFAHNTLQSVMKDLDIEAWDTLIKDYHDDANDKDPDPTIRIRPIKS